MLDSKLLGWKEKLLSNAEKEILIKTMAQAMPTYTMRVFRDETTLWLGGAVAPLKF